MSFWNDVSSVVYGMRFSPRTRITVRTGTVAALVLGGAAAATLVVAPPAAATETYTLPATGSITVYGKGNGHGHGMSQYGAQGAALQGLTSSQILNFYYPGTTLTDIGPTTIRVLIGEAGSSTTVLVAPGINLNFANAGHALPTTGIARYRLVPSGAGLKLQRLTTTWADMAGYTALPRQADFGTSSGVVRLALSDGTLADYRGTVGGYNNGSGLWTINRVGLDQYTQGVVPRESPSSWQAAALQAQAVAARSYGRNAVESHTGSAYDICDTTSCQVYGGLARLSGSGSRLYGEEASTNQAVAATSNDVLRYGGATIFAQFSASNGGYTAAGGYPYLPHKPDPYDNAASGDPFLSWTRSIPVSSIASNFGLARATSIEVTQRDGGGAWGGRVLQAYVNGVQFDGSPARVSAGIGTMQSFFGGGRSNWIGFTNSVPALTTGGAVIAATSHKVETFAGTSTGHLQMTEWVSGAGWSDPVDLGTPPNGALTWDPAAATSGGTNHIDVAVRDNRGLLVTRSFTSGPGWSPWRQSTVAMASSPAAVSPVPGQLYIYFRQADAGLGYVRWTQSSGWSDVQTVPGVSDMASGPDAAAPVSGSSAQDVVYRSTAGGLRVVHFTGSVWQPPIVVNPFQNPPAGRALDPAIGSDGAGNTDIAFTATSGVVYHVRHTAAGGWSAWYAVPGTGVSSAPSQWITTRGATYFARVNGALSTISYGTSWSTWSPTGG